MGLGRITRFASTPARARRVNVMRAGRAGVKALAPPDDLFADFSREKTAARGAGETAEAAHATAFSRTRYRDRFRSHITGQAESRDALRALVDEARRGDVYVMCMCPYRTPGDACHTYLLLELAREVDPKLRILPEPKPATRGEPTARGEPATRGRPAKRGGSPTVRAARRAAASKREKRVRPAAKRRR